MSSEDAFAETKEDLLESMIEELRCSICKGYLSSSPLRVLSDGNSICGRCTPPSNETPICRHLALENAVNKVTFPCRFKKQGCLQRSSFDHVFEHETACEYHTFTCFALPYGTCSWEGPIFEILEHFGKNHSEYLMEGNEFKINVEEDTKEGMFIFQKYDVITIIRYCYDLGKKEWTYCMQYLAIKNPEVFYKVKVYNDEDRDSYVTLKQNACERYKPDVVPSICVLNMKPYLEILGNPSTIVFSINLKLGNVKNPALNYDLLATLKCSCCGIYVTPPIFRGSHGELVCTDCGENNKRCTKSDEENLKKIMNQVNYPCRWQWCKVIEKLDNIRKHENDCLHREFVCPIAKCDKTYKRGGAIDHFDVYHDHVYFTDTYKFYATSRMHSNLFTVKMDEVIVIECMIPPEAKFIYRVTPPSKADSIVLHFEYYPKQTDLVNLRNNLWARSCNIDAIKTFTAVFTVK